MNFDRHEIYLAKTFIRSYFLTHQLSRRKSEKEPDCQIKRMEVEGSSRQYGGGGYGGGYGGFIQCCQGEFLHIKIDVKSMMVASSANQLKSKQ